MTVLSEMKIGNTAFRDMTTQFTNLAKDTYERSPGRRAFG